ncbi:MAG TPA: GatB/YqeY domain-containing protein [Gammaproteobacteria bacterium]|nr:GatB/YqeY domain-containing protein [Gammaproteobacteria bacterium]
MSQLKDRILEDTKDAMRARDKARLGVLRLITAAIKQKEVDERIELDDAAVLAVLEKMVKQRRDSIAQYEKAGRDDLREVEEFELQLIQTYLPEQLSDDEIAALIDKAIATTGAASMKDMGKVMGMLKPKLAGRADMGKVSQAIKQRLSG